MFWGKHMIRKVCCAAGDTLTPPCTAKERPELQAGSGSHQFWVDFRGSNSFYLCCCCLFIWWGSGVCFLDSATLLLFMTVCNNRRLNLVSFLMQHWETESPAHRHPKNFSEHTSCLYQDHLAVFSLKLHILYSGWSQLCCGPAGFFTTASSQSIQANSSGFVQSWSSSTCTPPDRPFLASFFCCWADSHYAQTKMLKSLQFDLCLHAFLIKLMILLQTLWRTAPLSSVVQHFIYEQTQLFSHIANFSTTFFLL